jgi:hypothetical protein
VVDAVFEWPVTHGGQYVTTGNACQVFN